MGKTSREIREQIQELEREYAARREAETVEAKAQIYAIMREHDLTLADLESKPLRKPQSVATPLPPMFRNEAGETWSGRGRTPHWLMGKDKEQYRITASQQSNT